MKKSLLLSLLLLLVPYSTIAEDIIHYTNGKSLSAKVVEVGPDYVKYRKASNLNGPIYSESIMQISRIDYENGTNDIWNHEPKVFDFNNSKFDLQFGVSASAFTVIPQFDVNFGYSPNRHFRVGLGLGFTNKDFDHSNAFLLPVFLNLKYTVLKTKFSPYVKAEYAYYLLRGDFSKNNPAEYLKFLLGVDWKMKHGYYFLDMGFELNSGVHDGGDFCFGIGYTHCF